MRRTGCQISSRLPPSRGFSDQVFEFNEKAPDRRARQQAEILRYTEEQFVALDTMVLSFRT